MRYSEPCGPGTSSQVPASSTSSSLTRTRSCCEVDEHPVDPVDDQPGHTAAEEKVAPVNHEIDLAVARVVQYPLEVGEEVRPAATPLDSWPDRLIEAEMGVGAEQDPDVPLAAHFPPRWARHGPCTPGPRIARWRASERQLTLPVRGNNSCCGQFIQPARIVSSTAVAPLLLWFCRATHDRHHVWPGGAVNPEDRIPSDPVALIRARVRAREVLWTYHVNLRLRDRFIPRQLILDSVDAYEIVETYPDDKYLPSYLILTHATGESFHVLFAIDVPGGNVIIVTAYRPSLDEWQPDLRARRKAT